VIARAHKGAVNERLGGAGESALRRGKRVVVLDLKQPGAVAEAMALVAAADALIEGNRPGVMERLGLGYGSFASEKPGLVYCSISAFGQTGPRAEEGGFDVTVQAMSGIMSVTGDGPDSPPAKCAPPLSDITAGIIAAMGVLAAYAHRLKTGKGQWLETSLFEAALVQTYWQSAIALATGVAPRAMGSAHPLNAPYQAFEAADGWIVIGGANQRNWLKIVDALGAPELASDPRFAHNPERMANLKELEAELGKRFRLKPAAHWLAVLDELGVPAGPVNDMLQALSDPQTIAREITRKSGGLLTFHVASLYPLLYKLEDRKWIQGRWVEKTGQRRRRYYRLTADGRKSLGTQRGRWAAFVAALTKAAGLEHA